MDATSDSGGVRRTGPEAARDAPIVDLGEVRRRRMTGAGRIPDEVWDAVARADELVDDLAARGQRVQFDTDAGRVVASLRDCDGRPLRGLSLDELLHPGEPGPSSAA